MRLENERPYLVAGAFSFFISRLLRRAALLGWMTPFRAARSRELIAANVAALASSGVASRAARTALRVLLRVILLRMRLRLLDRMRLIAEAVLANGNSPDSNKGLIEPRFYLRLKDLSSEAVDRLRRLWYHSAPN